MNVFSEVTATLSQEFSEVYFKTFCWNDLENICKKYDLICRLDASVSNPVSSTQGSVVFISGTLKNMVRVQSQFELLSMLQINDSPESGKPHDKLTETTQTPHVKREELPDFGGKEQKNGAWKRQMNQNCCATGMASKAVVTSKLPDDVAPQTFATRTNPMYDLVHSESYFKTMTDVISDTKPEILDDLVTCTLHVNDQQNDFHSNSKLFCQPPSDADPHVCDTTAEVSPISSTAETITTGTLNEQDVTLFNCEEGEDEDNLIPVNNKLENVSCVDHLKSNTSDKTGEMIDGLVEVTVKSIKRKRRSMNFKNTKNTGKECKCSHCNIILSCRNSLNVHLQRKHRTQKLKCDLCDKTYGLKKDLREHKDGVHGPPKYFCNICKKFFAWPQLYNKHKKLHKNIKYSPPRGQSSGQKAADSDNSLVTNVIEAPVHQMAILTKQHHHNQVHEQSKDTCSSKSDETLNIVTGKDEDRSENSNGSPALQDLENICVIPLKQKGSETADLLMGTAVPGTVEKTDASEKLTFNKPDHKAQLHATNTCSVTKRKRGRPKGSCGKPKQSRLFSQGKSSVAFNTQWESVNSSDEHLCKACGDVLPSEEDLIRHVESLHNFAKRGRGRPKKVKMLEPSAYKCPHCDISCSQKSGLYIHVKRKHTVPNLKCKFCERKYAVKIDLTEHMRSVHGPERYFCEVCKRFFKHHQNFNKHMKTHREDYVPITYQCYQCGKVYSSAAGLASHSVTAHQEGKSHVCTICGKGFALKGGLVYHMKSHSKEYARRSWICDKCGKSFQDKQILIRHEKTHEDSKPHQCDICHKFFKTLSSLRKHQTIHTGKKTHSCSVCSKEFWAAASVIRHERIHTGYKPFKCSVCSRQFRDYSIAQRHAMLVHKMDLKSWKSIIVAEHNKWL